MVMKDLTNARFGRLVAVKSVGAYRGNALWLCKCDCGGSKTARSGHLIAGRTKSCGCYRAERSRETGLQNMKHGMHTSSEYKSWDAMRQRCWNPSASGYKHYGGRGITVCERWANSFENFLADMGRKPTPQHSIDRIDNDGNYEPSNCRWATKSEQRLNQRPRWRIAA